MRQAKSRTRYNQDTIKYGMDKKRLHSVSNSSDMSNFSSINNSQNQLFTGSKDEKKEEEKH